MQIKERLKRRDEAAEYIERTFGMPISKRTLANYAVAGGGPAFRKVGRYPLYAADDLDAWVQSRIGRRVTSTSEYAGAA